MGTLVIIIWLIFVQPTGETFTEQEQQEAINSTQAALDFWGIEAEIRTQFIAVDNPYGVPTWAVSSQEDKRLYVVDNSESRSLFFGNLSGYADHYHGFASVVNTSYLPATISHEFGHLLFNADDLYTIPNACNQLDIMCDAQSAYNARVIGCQTLERIGRTCYKVYLPLTMNTENKAKTLADQVQDIVDISVASNIPIDYTTLNKVVEKIREYHDLDQQLRLLESNILAMLGLYARYLQIKIAEKIST